MLGSNCLGHMFLVRLKISNGISLSGSPHTGVQRQMLYFVNSLNCLDVDILNITFGSGFVKKIID